MSRKNEICTRPRNSQHILLLSPLSKNMIMAAPLCFLAVLLSSRADGFQSILTGRRKSASSLFYKSDETAEKESAALTHGHTPLLTHYCDNFLGESSFQFQEELWSQEWHDSFVRNGLVDFVPPLSSSLNCLLVGIGHSMDALRSGKSRTTAGILKGQYESSSDKHQGNMVKNSELDDPESMLARHESILARLFGETLLDEESNIDCILDRGLMNELLTMEGSDKDVGLLLLEATRHIREHGVYIVVTKELSDATKEYLNNVGSLLGMQWKFDLDGISEEDATVSVARKYFAGELPTAGKLAQVKRPTP